MKGVLFTGIIFLLILALYFKFVHNRVTGAETKAYGYDEDYGYDAE